MGKIGGVWGTGRKVMIPRSEGSWLRRSRRSRSGRIGRRNRTKPIQQGLFHPSIENQRTGYSDHRMDGYQGICIEEETYAQIECSYQSQDEQVKQIDGI